MTPARLRSRVHPRHHVTLHGHPPITMAAVLLRSRLVLPAIVVAFSVLALLAWRNDGSALRTWDLPVQHWAEGHRGDDVSTFFLGASQLGGLVFITLGLGTLLYVVYRRCHALGVVLLSAAFARPALEWALKELVGRPRPDFERLVPGLGPSFPSGHVMAAVALWGLVPAVVALVTHRRRLWWASVGVSGAAVALVAASRIYLGVHWLSDVVGALLLGTLYLLGVEYLLDWHHERSGCAPLDVAEAGLQTKGTNTRPGDGPPA